MLNNPIRYALVKGDKTYGQITDDLLANVEQKPPLWWYGAMTIGTILLAIGAWAVYMSLSQGLGTWGLTNSVAWGWDIINFVWWIGIGHAGTAFSIFFLIFRQKWAGSINRSAEAMTVFAVVCAAMFPLLHMGRPWLAFYIVPYPNTRLLWLNFNSPLFWDVLAITTYLITSIMLWYMGMVPDLATIAQRTKSKVGKFLYGMFSMGWNGSLYSYNRYESLMKILGGLAAPLVISVHTIVALDFAVSVMPGWHTTILPPYFFVGAIFSGFAMVLTIMILLRRAFNLTDYVTEKHLDNIAHVLKFGSLIIGLAYVTELFTAWYSGVEYEIFTFFRARATGTYSTAFWIMFTFNAVVPQLFWFKKARRNLVILFLVSIVINIGIWFERYIILVSTLAQDYLPSSWTAYHPTMVDIGIYLGTFGLFTCGMMMFIRYIPIIAVNEIKPIARAEKLRKQKKQNHEH
ncbi:MAG: NrfD/PsrC family molybdoenzyme membrane anchor subunit [Bacteroides sp.]|jgi:molybdopterin-containing oxidoreductase family membrane subunit|nr:NrfD/PsrC family molybdoenzyme membrane anchor subunit [Bacteroides sp.]